MFSSYNCTSWYLSLDDDANSNSLDITVSNGRYVGGRRNKAIEVSTTTVVSTSSWGANDCPSRPSQCERGLTVAFWAKFNVTLPNITVLSTIDGNSMGFDIKFDGTDTSLRYTLNDGERIYTGKTQTNVTLCLIEWCHITTVWDKLGESFLISINNGEPFYSSSYTNFTTPTNGSNLKITKGIPAGNLYIDEIYIQDEIFTVLNIDLLYGKKSFISLFFWFTYF